MYRNYGRSHRQISDTEVKYRTSVRKVYGTWTAHVREFRYRPEVSGSARPATVISEFKPYDVLGDRILPVSETGTFSGRHSFSDAEPASVFKFLDAIRPKSLADKVKDILQMKEMDPNAWTPFG
jgi:hypothetical protein